MDRIYQGHPAAQPPWDPRQASQVTSAADAPGRRAPEAPMGLTGDHLSAGSPGTATPLFQQQPTGDAQRESKMGTYYDSARGIKIPPFLPQPLPLRLPVQSVQQAGNTPYYHGTMETPRETTFLPTCNEQMFRDRLGNTHPFMARPTPLEPIFNLPGPPNPFAPLPTPNKPRFGDMSGNINPFAVPNLHAAMDRGAAIPIRPRLLQTPQQPTTYVLTPNAPIVPARPKRVAQLEGPARYNDAISQEPLLHRFNPKADMEIRNAQLVVDKRTALSNTVAHKNGAFTLSPPPGLPGEQAAKKPVGRPSNESRQQANGNYSQQPRPGALWEDFGHTASVSASSAGGSSHPDPRVPLVYSFDIHRQTPSPYLAALRGGGSGYAASMPAYGTEGSFRSIHEFSFAPPVDGCSQPPNPFSASTGRGFNGTSATEAEKRIADAANVHSVSEISSASGSDHIRSMAVGVVTLLALQVSEPDLPLPLATGDFVKGVDEKGEDKEPEPAPREKQNGYANWIGKSGRPQEGNDPADENASGRVKRRQSDPKLPLRQSTRLKENTAKAKGNMLK